ncbi:MAG: hypothetical protein SFT81_07360 [Candidatus Caenarcaniphilales bacterium]|nr:hypothetical protein [Candidatus Caenarcaniphilales bacterium]
MQPINPYNNVGSYASLSPSGYSPPVTVYRGVSTPSSPIHNTGERRPVSSFLGSVKTYFKRLGFALFGFDLRSKEEKEASLFNRFKEKNTEQVSYDPNGYNPQQFDSTIGYWPSELEGYSSFPGSSNAIPATVPPPASAYGPSQEQLTLDPPQSQTGELPKAGQFGELLRDYQNTQQSNDEALRIIRQDQSATLDPELLG